MAAVHPTVYTGPPRAVNPDALLASDPMFVLLAWAAGIGLAAAAVTIGGLVGPGFTWLAVATAVLIGIWAVQDGHPVVITAAGTMVVGGIIVKGSRQASGVLVALAAGLFALHAVGYGGVILTVTAVLALGGITGEMLLGHWYLVDPTLPRGVLRLLAVAGAIGVILDAAMVSLLLDGVASGIGAVVFWVLAAFTLILMLAVLGALRYPAYSGVMAATGLSYLAVLTGLAAVFMGRVLAAGGGPFS